MATLTWNGQLGSNWSTVSGVHTNWTSNTIPVAGDTLIFPASATSFTPHDDLTAGTQFNLDFTGGGYTVTGNAINLSGNGIVATDESLTINSIANDLSLNTTSTVNLGSGSFMTLSGVISGNSGLTLSGPGYLALNGANIYLGNTSVNNGTLDVEGSLSANGVVQLDGGSLTGFGTVGDVTQLSTASSIDLAPTDGPGGLNTGSLSLADPTSFNVQVDSATSYGLDNVAANLFGNQSLGNVSLGNAVLNLTMLYTPVTGDTYEIIHNDGIDPVVGTFSGMPQGSTFNVNGTTFRILYDGGDGNDVTLTAIGNPTVKPDSYAGPENTPIVISSPSQGVLANDTDPNELNLQAVLVTGPSDGSLQLNGNGTFTYIPSPLFTGTDSFTYMATNGANDSLVTTVTLNVNATSDAPVANDDSYTVAENGSLAVDSPGVLLNDYSPLGYSLTAVGVIPPVHAQSFTFDPNTGAFTYVPVAGYTGPDTFTYRAYASAVNEDGGPPAPINSQYSNIATVTINVTPINLAPTPVNDSFTAEGDQTLSVVGPGVLANDLNPNPSTPATVYLTSAPTHGTVTLSADGSFNYTPFTYYSGTDSFTYRSIVGNALSENAGTVTITVLPVDHAPVARDDISTVAENQFVVVNVLANDSDYDGHPITATIVNPPLHGTLAAGPGTSFTYTPNVGYVGTDFFTYRATDGTLSSDIATANITVTPVNSAPTAVDDTFTVSENNVLSISAPGVLANDTDPQNDTLSAVLLQAPSNGSLTLNSNGSFVYTPLPNFYGVDTFQYLASDGLLPSAPATVTINVSFQPSKPIAADYAFNGSEDTTLAISAPGLGLNSTIAEPDEEGSPQFVVFNQPLHAAAFILNDDGSFSYVPVANYNGPDSFTYYIRDNGVNSNFATVNLNIAPVPDRPVAVNYTYTTNQETPLSVAGPGVLADDINVDGDALHAALVNGPTGGNVVLNADGSFTYTPNAGFSGTDTFTYRAINTSLPSLPATVTIVVRPVNHPPIAVDDLYITDRDQRISTPAPGVLGNDGDPDPTTIIQSQLVNSPQHGQVTLNPDGSFDYTPDPSFSGTDWFTYRDFDGITVSGVATVRINVNPAVQTTVNLDPNSDTGYSNTDRITKDNTPTFVGVTGPGLEVQLSVRPLGSNGPANVVGTTTADSEGNYQVSSNQLADGDYQFFVTPYRADGLSYGGVLAGPLLIDTVAPQITAISLHPALSQIYITFQDDHSGINSFTVASPYNYSLAKASARGDQSFTPSNFQVLPSVLNPLTETVVIQVAQGRGLGLGTYYFAALSGGNTGIADVAGNALSGTFSGTLPSGSTTPGGDFKAAFVVNGAATIAPTTTTDFIPILAPTIKPARTNHYAARLYQAQLRLAQQSSTPTGPLTAFRHQHSRKR